MMLMCDGWVLSIGILLSLTMRLTIGWVPWFISFTSSCLCLKQAHAFGGCCGRIRNNQHQASQRAPAQDISNSAVYASYHPSVLDNVAEIEAAERELLRSSPSNSNGTHSHPTPDSPTVSSFMSVVEEWLRIGAPDRAEALIDVMEVFHAVDGRMYEKIIDAWCGQALEYGEKLRRWNSSLYNHTQTMEHNQIAKYGIEAANKALSLLDRLEQLYQATGDTNFRPSISTYSKVINAFTRGNTLWLYSHADSMDQTVRGKLRAHVNGTIEQLRQRRDRMYSYPQEKNMVPTSDSDIYNMIQQYEGGTDILLALNFTTRQDGLSLRQYNAIIHALAISKRPWAPFVAEGMFDYMVARFKERVHSSTSNRLLVQPDIYTINECIHAWASISDMPHTADRAEKVLEKLRHIQTTEGLLLDVLPDKVSYNTIIKAYANVGNVVRADEILNMMESLYNSSGDINIRPDLISYSCVLHAYARASRLDAGAAKKAEDILAQMYKQYKAGVNPDIQPTTILFNNVINAHAERGSGIRAYMLLMLMEDMAQRDDGGTVRPDIYTYNSVLKAIANSKENGALNRAEQLVKKMQASPLIQPDIVSYNTFIDIIARCGGKAAGRKAEEVFNKLPGIGLKANAATYTSLINAWTLCGDSHGLHKSEALVETLLNQTMNSPQVTSSLPDTSIYNALIKCVCKYTSVQRALDILSTMESFESIGLRHISPNSKSYTIIIDCIASDGKPDVNSCNMAVGILDRMIARYKLGFQDSRPNAFTYSCLIKCYARSKLKDKADRALKILQRMEEDYRTGNNSAQPNIIVYNALLNACAYSSKEYCAEEAFRIACLIFDEIRTSDYMRPTHVTFATFLKVVENMMPESMMKNDLIEGVIRRCSREGLCSPMVMSQLSRTANPKLLTKLINGEENVNEIPSYWSRNV